jgi:hypothetical protein
MRIGRPSWSAAARCCEQAQATAEQEADQNARLSTLEQQSVPAQASAGPSTLDQLTAMHGQGALTDTEFAAAKAKLLGI